MIDRFIPERGPEELEQRLRFLRQRRRPALQVARIRLSWPPSRRTLLIAGVLVVTMVGGSVYLTTRQRGDQPITRAISDQVPFPLLEPSSLPNGVVYRTGSTTVSHSIVGYVVQSPNGAITINEQAAPPSLPDFEAMGMKRSQVPAGTAYVGSTSGRPAIIVISSTTLISISAESGVPAALVEQVVHSLASPRH